jgi:hypothetical protein
VCGPEVVVVEPTTLSATDEVVYGVSTVLAADPADEVVSPENVQTLLLVVPAESALGRRAP